MRNRTFHRASIGGMVFDGIVSADGPYLSCQMSGGVALGVSGLRHFRPEHWTARSAPSLGWWVVKYRDEARIFLPGFGLTAIRELSAKFGLCLLAGDDLDPSDQVRREYFFTSPAWESLRQWVAKHLRLARAHAACDPYLRCWYGRAILEAKALSP